MQCSGDIRCAQKTHRKFLIEINRIKLQEKDMTPRVDYREEGMGMSW